MKSQFFKKIVRLGYYTNNWHLGMNTKLETDLMTPIRKYIDEVFILRRVHYHETTEVVTENLVKLNECLTKKQKNRIPVYMVVPCR